MAENPRIEELRRRVQKDPASIAFAQLAEEFRRAGRFEEAIAAWNRALAGDGSSIDRADIDKRIRDARQQLKK